MKTRYRRGLIGERDAGAPFHHRPAAARITQSLLAALVASSTTTQVPPGGAAVRQALQPSGVGCVGYDEARSQGLLFATNGETWSWDGTRWFAQYPSTRPPARTNARMAWDPNRRSMLLFGGYVSLFGPPYFNDTWLWSGHNWFQVQTPGPSARHSPGVATDPIRRRVVLFGGEDVSGISLSDTWEWDGVRWTQITPASTTPLARFDPMMAWNPATGRVAMFGGKRFPFMTVNLLPCAEWDGQNWTLINGPVPGNLPQGYSEGTAVSDPGGAGVHLFATWVLLGGGSTPPPIPQHWLWNGQSLTVRDLGPEPPTIGPYHLFSDITRRQAIAFSPSPLEPRDTVSYGFAAPGWQSRIRVTDPPGINLSTVSYLPYVPWQGGFFTMDSLGLPWLRTEAGWSAMGSAPLFGTAPIVTRPFVDTFTGDIYAIGNGSVGSESPLYRYNGIEATPTWTRIPYSQHGIPGIGAPGWIHVAQDPMDHHHWFRRASALHKWDGSSMTQVVVFGGPVCAMTPKFAYDPDRNVFAEIFYDLPSCSAGPLILREWNGTTLTDTPAPVIHPEAPDLAHVPGLGLVLGSSQGFWSWNGAQWRQLLPGGLRPSIGVRGMAYDPCRHRLRVVNYAIDMLWEDHWDLYVDDFHASTSEPVPGQSLQLTVSSPAHAGQPWLLLMSQSDKGIPLAGLHPEPCRILPLAIDDLLLASLGDGIRGILDVQGSGTVALRVPNDPAFVGFLCRAVALSIAGNGQLGLVSRPVELHVMP
jgi:hypothetical protein